MAVFRVNKDSNYTCMSNYHLKDRKLSLKAKGLLSVMLSLPESWDYSIKGLAAICKEGEDSIKSTLSELKKTGYLTITKESPSKDNSGRYKYIYDIYEKPENTRGEKQPLVFQPLEIQPLENTPLNINTKESSTQESNTKEVSTDNKKERKKKAQQTYDEILDSDGTITFNSDLKNAFIEFIKMRKLIKKPLTDYALKQIIKKTRDLANDDPDIMQRILEQSIENSWQGVFPLKENNRYHTNPFNNAHNDQMAIIDQMIGECGNDETGFIGGF